MLLDLLEGKKKKGFFSRKFAKLRGKKDKKKDEDKVAEKKAKKDKKKEAKEMEKVKAKNRASTKLAMKEALGEGAPKPAAEEDINIRESITSKRRERRESVADKMLTRQISKYNDRFGFKKNVPNEMAPTESEMLEYSTEL